MKALVTGATGFIGSSLVEELNSQGIDVVALVRKTSKLDNLVGLKYEMVEGSLSEPASLEKALEGVDLVFHLAGAIAARSKKAFYLNNTAGTRNLVEAAIRVPHKKKRHFIYVSSLAAGGPAESMRPIEETHPDRPVSEYGRSKLGAENELREFADRLAISVVRPPVVYGPRDRGVLKAVRLAKGRVSPLLLGDNQERRKYYSSIFVRDLCRGLVLVSQYASLAHARGQMECFYLSGDEILSFNEMFEVMAEALGNEPLRLRVSPKILKGMRKVLSPMGVDKLNELVPDYWICSNQKAKTELGFEPEHNFRDAMKETVEWYKGAAWL